MLIKAIHAASLSPALALIKRVFDEYEAPDYSPEGIAQFHSFISYENIVANLDGGNFKCWGAYENERILGVIATRNINHIAMFFVDGAHHRKGIGRQLYQTVADDAKQNGKAFITLNSSPYAVPVYHRLGFGYTDVERVTDGIRYTPMKAFLHGKTLGQVTDDERAALFPVILSPHNPAWKAAFEAEKSAIQALPCAANITAIHHYGSTAIDGIHAKPCVDILLEIKENTDLDQLIGCFVGAGYIYIHYAADSAPHIMFMKGYTDVGFVGQTFHIHVRYPGIHDELLFRDYLIAHPDKARSSNRLCSLQEIEVKPHGLGYANAH